MIGMSRLRRILVPIVLAGLGVGASDAIASSPDLPPPESDCPYANVYVAVSTSGSRKDARIAKRVRHAYSDSLSEQGFSVVSAPEDAYWSAFSMVRLNPRIEPSFAWTVYMMATQDAGGRVQSPRDFEGEAGDQGELSGFMLLREVRLLELELEARSAALDTAGALLPHATRMCTAWTLSPEGDEPSHESGEIFQVQREDDPYEELRRELREEIARVRRDRDRQRRLLEIGVTEPSGS
jgi:hypothetical protein